MSMAETEMDELVPVANASPSASPQVHRHPRYHQNESESWIQKLKANKHEIALVLTTLFISITAIVLADRANATISRMEGKLEVLEVLIGKYESKITSLEAYDARLTSLLDTYASTCIGVTSTLDEIVRVNASVTAVARITDTKYDAIRRDLSQVVPLRESVTQLRQLWVNWNPTALQIEREVVFDEVEGVSTIYCTTLIDGGFIAFGSDSMVHVFNETGGLKRSWSPQRNSGYFSFNKCGQSGVFGEHVFAVEQYSERVSPTSSKQAYRVNMFSWQGDYVRSFGTGYTDGSADGEGSISSVVATDEYVFTYDDTNHRIQAFRASVGVFSHNWGGGGGSGDGQFSSATEVPLYVHDGYVISQHKWSASSRRYYVRLQWFTQSGVFVRKVQQSSSTNEPYGIFFLGLVFVQDFFYSLVQEVNIFTMGGIFWIGKFDITTGQFIQFIPFKAEAYMSTVPAAVAPSMLLAQTGLGKPKRYAFFNVTIPWNMHRTVFPRM